jgi:glycosyltransferase involved in cell wall biosynthesis
VADHLDLPQAVALPNPVGLPPDARPRHLPARPLQVASLSALLPWKGVEHFVRAAAYLRQPDRVDLHVFGDGPEGPTLRRLAGPRVTFHGAVRDVAARLRHEIDVVVLPSIQPEACPMANLEAMAEGVPVITTRIGGGAEFVRDGVTGVHVPVADPAAIAAAIDGYLDDPGRYHAHSTAALEHVQAHGRERYAEQLEALFAPWLGAGGPLSRPPANG